MTASTAACRTPRSSSLMCYLPWHTGCLGAKAPRPESWQPKVPLALGPNWPSPASVMGMAVIDVAGYVAELKDHAVDHGFHVHDERHFVETYSLRQFWEVDLHPEEGCGGPISLHLALEVDPRTLLDFEDAVVALPDDADPEDKWSFPLTFNWGVPPLPEAPDLLRLAIDLAGIGGID